MSARNFGMTRPAATTGECPLPASRRVTQYYAGNSFEHRYDDGRCRDHQGKFCDPKGFKRQFLRVVPLHPCVEIHPLPSGSIAAPISPLEPIDLAQARLKEALLFALPVSLFLWGILALIVWALFF